MASLFSRTFSRLPQTLRPARLLTGAVRLQSRCIFSLGSSKTHEDVDKSSKLEANSLQLLSTDTAHKIQ